MMTARCGTVFIWFPNVAGFTESLRSIKKSLDALCIQAFFMFHPLLLLMRRISTYACAVLTHQCRTILFYSRIWGRLPFH